MFSHMFVTHLMMFAVLASKSFCVMCQQNNFHTSLCYSSVTSRECILVSHCFSAFMSVYVNVHADKWNKVLQEQEQRESL